MSSDLQFEAAAGHMPNDPQPDPEPAAPSLPEPDPGVFHHEVPTRTAGAAAPGSDASVPTS